MLYAKKTHKKSNIYLAITFHSSLARHATNRLAHRVYINVRSTLTFACLLFTARERKDAKNENPPKQKILGLMSGTAIALSVLMHRDHASVFSLEFK